MVADSADVVVVAPATARWLGAMANGIANDVVTATCLATQRAGASSPRRWTATCGRTARRATTWPGSSVDFGYRIVPPEIGSLASGQ